jgi:type II secretory pathway pseudopilin PulG
MQRGFSFTEVLVAMGLLTTMTAGVAGMIMLATARNLAARHQVLTSTLATEKMERIRSQNFAYDASGVPITDFTTNLAACVSDASGTGLGASPSNALDADHAGFVDYLDARGVCLGGGASAPAGTIYTRRWAIVPLEADPSNGLVVGVLVTLTAAEKGRPPGSPRQRRPEDTLLVSMRGRSAAQEN